MLIASTYYRTVSIKWRALRAFSWVMRNQLLGLWRFDITIGLFRKLLILQSEKWWLAAPDDFRNSRTREALRRRGQMAW